MAHVLLEGISKHFGPVKVIEDLDLRIEDREFLVLVGPSGCGKSTVLRLLAGLEELTAGTIRIGGRVVNDVAPKDRDIAMVFQSYALYPHMSVRQNLEFGLRIRRVPAAEIAQLVKQDDPLQPPLVDIIVPAGTTQEAVLKDYDVHAKRPVRLVGVVPAASAGASARSTW